VRSPAIHLVNLFSTAYAGSERRTLAYHALLAEHAEVTLWAEGEPDATLHRHPIRRIDPTSQSIPCGGTLVLVGVFANRESWLAQAQPQRLIIVFNTPELLRLNRLLEFIERTGLPPPDLIFPSDTHRQSTGFPGFVDWGVFDFEAFTPRSRETASRSFTVGRLSRDEDYKHHPHDARLYRGLVDRGMRVRLMGATKVADRFPNFAAIEVLPVGSVPAPDFLHSLDAFVYRTDPCWREASGRVVVEAMACALPVVGGRSGGYRELIEHEANGFLFDTHQEAIGYLETLRADPGLAERVGAAARATVMKRFGPAHHARVREFLLRSPGAA
jgi:glycosyltransferase involved in cell wall biosynthesis